MLSHDISSQPARSSTLGVALARSARLLQRIDPAQPGKAAEIAIVAVHHRLIFDRQCRDVRIGEQGGVARAGCA